MCVSVSVTSVSSSITSTPARQTDTMELEVNKGVGRARPARSRVNVWGPSWGLSGRLGVRVLMHRDHLTCRFLQGSLPHVWLQRYWGKQRFCHLSSFSRLFPALRKGDKSSLAPDGPSSSPQVPGMTLSPPRPSAQPAASSSSSSSHSHTAAAYLNHNSSSGLVLTTASHLTNQSAGYIS